MHINRDTDPFYREFKKDLNNYSIKNEDIKKLFSKTLALTGYIVAMRAEIWNDQKAVRANLQVLNKQVNLMKENLDFIRAYLDIRIEHDEDN